LDTDVRSYRWTFSDQSTADGTRVHREYTVPGEYSEMLTVTDDRGNVSHDFCTVLLADSKNPERTVPCIHAAYHPSLDVRPGTEITGSASLRVGTWIRSAEVISDPWAGLGF